MMKLIYINILITDLIIKLYITIINITWNTIKKYIYNILLRKYCYKILQ